MNYVDLDKEGFANYRLYSDGSVKRMPDGNLKAPSRYFTCWKNNKPRTFATAILLRRYFGNELQALPKEEVANLAPLGYPDYSVTFDGRAWTHHTETWLHPTERKKGYWEVKLTDTKGKVHSIYIHTLIAKMFVPNPNHYDQVDHKDGCKAHNAAWNLEWVSGVENVRRARMKGLKPMAVTDNEIHVACQMIVDGYSDREIAKVVHTYPQIIEHIRKGHTHCEISSQYGIEEHRIRNRVIDYSKYKKDQSKFKTYVPKQDSVTLDDYEHYTRKSVAHKLLNCWNVLKPHCLVTGTER